MVMEFERTEVLPPVAPSTPSDSPSDSREGNAGRIVAVVAVIAALLVIALGVAEWLARSSVQSAIAEFVVTETELPASQHVEVEISGLLLPQLLVRNLSAVTISSPNVNIAGTAGDLSMTIFDLPTETDRPISSARGEVRFDADQLTYMAAAAAAAGGAESGVKIGSGGASFGFDGTDVTLSVDQPTLGQNAAVGVAFTPGLSNGNLTLALSSVQLGQNKVTTDDLRAQYGDEASASLQPQTVCLAADLPSSLRFTTIAVEGRELVGRFDIATTSIDAAALQQNGTCV